MYDRKPIPRNELLSWINTFLQTSYCKLEDASNGAVACQILDAIFPSKNYVPMRQLDFAASTPYDCQKNYQVLKGVINKLNLPLNVNISSLSKQGSKESYEFLSELKTFFDENYSGAPYDAVSKRRESKGSPKVTRVDQPNRSNQIKHKISPRQTYLSPVRSPVRSPVQVASPDSTDDSSVSNELFKKTKELEILSAELDDLRGKLSACTNVINLYKQREALLLRERSFYYDKLTEIESLLVEEQESRSLSQTEQAIFSILYSAEGLNSCDSDEGVSD